MFQAGFDWRGNSPVKTDGDVLIRTTGGMEYWVSHLPLRPSSCPFGI